MGKEDPHVKTQVAQASKIVFTKDNACWLIHTPDYPTTDTEAFITDNPHCHDNHYSVSTQISEGACVAYCLEMMQKFVYQFEKRIARSMRKNRCSKNTKTHPPTTVLYKDIPIIPSPEKWQPDNQTLPPQMLKFIVHNDPTIPKQLKRNQDLRQRYH